METISWNPSLCWRRDTCVSRSVDQVSTCDVAADDRHLLTPGHVDLVVPDSSVVDDDTDHGAGTQHPAWSKLALEKLFIIKY